MAYHEYNNPQKMAYYKYNNPENCDFPISFVYVEPRLFTDWEIPHSLHTEV
jgi:hypothetical protein